MKPTKRMATDKFVRINFEDVGELTNHLKEMIVDTRSSNSTYDSMEWDELCQKHGICGDSKQDWN